MSEEENTKGITRRQFLKGFAVASAALALGEVVGPEAVKAQSEVSERLSLVEGLQKPTLIIDKLEKHIFDEGVENGEYYRNFLENFSIEHSSEPDLARQNREALDYAFGERRLGQRIIDIYDKDSKDLHPDLDIEERMLLARSGENSTIESVVSTFKGLEIISRNDISEDSGEINVTNLLSISEWIRPLHEQQDYQKEKDIYKSRAEELNQRNNLYKNTYEAWEQEGELVQDAFMRVMDLQESYFPIADAGLGSIIPDEYPYHTANNNLLEEIHLGNNFSVGVLENDEEQVGYGIGQLIHEQSHQFQRETLDFDLVQVLHPEDLMEQYEVMQGLGEGFDNLLQSMSSEEIINFLNHPHIGIKFSDSQFPRQRVDSSVMQLDLTRLRNLYNYIEANPEIVSNTGMDYFFGDNVDYITTNAGFYPGKFDNQLIQTLEGMTDFESTNYATREIALKILSHMNFASYAMLLKLESSGQLTQDSEIQQAFLSLKRIVHGQIGHATQGPVGGYISPPGEFGDILEGQVTLAEKFKLLNEGQGKPGNLVNLLYDQTLTRMDAQARLWGGNSLEDYDNFVRDAVQVTLT